MVNVNRNSALDTLQGLVEQSFSQNLKNMPDQFSKQQQMALELFKQRIYLDEVIEKTISFNRNLNWESEDSNLSLVKSAENLIDIYKLRSDIYKEIGFQKEFPDEIDGLNFDSFDKNSAIIYYKKNEEISGTVRLIFDSENKLLTESKFSFNEHRQKYGLVCELSRLVIPNKNKSLGLEFKKLTEGIYTVYKLNDIGVIISGMRLEHYKWYKRFGGFVIEKEMDGYGKLNEPFCITSWDPSKISPFFKKVFLNIK